MSSNILTSLAFGPCCLVYAWALLTRKHFTHVFGVTLSTAMIAVQLLFFMTAFAESWNFFEFDSSSNLSVQIWFFFVNVLARLVFPLVLSTVEHKRAIGIRFEHDEYSTRFKKEEDHFSLDAAEVLFGGGSFEDLQKLVDQNYPTGTDNSPRSSPVAGNNNNKSDALTRRPQTPFKKASL
jgi:hypothetical protein